MQVTQLYLTPEGRKAPCARRASIDPSRIRRQSTLAVSYVAPETPPESPSEEEVLPPVGRRARSFPEGYAPPQRRRCSLVELVAEECHISENLDIKAPFAATRATIATPSTRTYKALREARRASYCSRAAEGEPLRGLVKRDGCHVRLAEVPVPSAAEKIETPSGIVSPVIREASEWSNGDVPLSTPPSSCFGASEAA